jgi:hypothetical protein
MTGLNSHPSVSSVGRILFVLEASAFDARNNVEDVKFFKTNKIDYRFGSSYPKDPYVIRFTTDPDVWLSSSWEKTLAKLKVLKCEYEIKNDNYSAIVSSEFYNLSFCKGVVTMKVLTSVAVHDASKKEIAAMSWFHVQTQDQTQDLRKIIEAQEDDNRKYRKSLEFEP